jgi:hypothetical protein
MADTVTRQHTLTRVSALLFHPLSGLTSTGACRQRFSLLFYGFGSKRALLESFADQALTDGGVLACDGLASGVNAKQVGACHRYSAAQGWF